MPDSKLTDMEKTAAAVSAAKSSFDVTANTTRWVATNGVRLFLQFWHSKTPIFGYPRGWVPWYVEWILGFPRAPYGTVSIQVWAAACATVVSLVGDLVPYAIQSTGRQGVKKKEEPIMFGAEGVDKKSR